MELNAGKSWKKTCLRKQKIVRWGLGSPSNVTNVMKWQQELQINSILFWIKIFNFFLLITWLSYFRFSH